MAYFCSYCEGSIPELLLGCDMSLCAPYRATRLRAYISLCAAYARLGDSAKAAHSMQAGCACAPTCHDNSNTACVFFVSTHNKWTSRLTEIKGECGCLFHIRRHLHMLYWRYLDRDWCRYGGSVVLLGRLWHTQRMLQVACACGLFVARGWVEYSMLGGQPTHGLANSLSVCRCGITQGVCLFGRRLVSCMSRGWHSMCWFFPCGVSTPSRYLCPSACHLPQRTAP